MEMFSRTMSFLLILFITCFFCLGKAIDCGGTSIAQTITVGHGREEFTTIQGAIDSIKTNNDRWVKIHIKPGLYLERITIPIEKPCIFLEGEDTRRTVINYWDHGTINYNSTFTSLASNLIAKHITFRNSYNVGSKIYKLERVGTDPIQQANAARIQGDKSFFFQCTFLGYQDTLFDFSGRHFFKECYIQGEVDFIYGAAQSYYENCSIVAVGKYPNIPGFVTAQGRDSSNDPGGYVFEGGSIIGNGQVNLGRAWRPYSRVIFHKTYLSSIVTPQGWDAWNAAGKEGTTTYAEVDCNGPGADTSKRVPWMKKLSSSDFQQFSFGSFINNDGWFDNLPAIS